MFLLSRVTFWYALIKRSSRGHVDYVCNSAGLGNFGQKKCERKRRSCETRSNRVLERRFLRNRHFRAPNLISFLRSIPRKSGVFNPELLPSPSDELSAEAAHSRGCASGNTLAPSSRGITLRARFALMPWRRLALVT